MCPSSLIRVLKMYESAGNRFLEPTELFRFLAPILSGQNNLAIQQNRETSARSLTNHLPCDQRSNEHSNLAAPNSDDLACQVVPPQLFEGESPTSTIRGQSNLDTNMACIFIACNSASAHKGAVDPQTPPQLISQDHNGTPRFDEALFAPSNNQSR